jgi:hypothetical protein
VAATVSRGDRTTRGTYRVEALALGPPLELEQRRSRKQNFTAEAGKSRNVISITERKEVRSHTAQTLSHRTVSSAGLEAATSCSRSLIPFPYERESEMAREWAKDRGPQRVRATRSDARGVRGAMFRDRGGSGGREAKASAPLPAGGIVATAATDSRQGTYRVEGLALGPSFELKPFRSSRAKQKERKPSREGVSANESGPRALRAASQPRGASDDGAAGTTYRLESRVGRGHELLEAIVVPHPLSLRARESKRIFAVQRIVGGACQSAPGQQDESRERRGKWREQARTG